MNKENILVLVRAIPEHSKKYGYRVCVAGINEKQEWRRLYPFRFEYGKGLIEFDKKDLIEVDLAEPENDKRKESRKVLQHKIIHKSLDEREIITRLTPLLTSIEKLETNESTLGVIKPILSDAEVVVNDTKLYDEQVYFSMTQDFLERREKVKLPIELHYKFKCGNESSCKGHNIILIDWELNELARNILKREQDKNMVAAKIRSKFFDFMLKRDLYFFVGTHFRFGTWMIIGLLYPDKELKIQKSLANY